MIQLDYRTPQPPADTHAGATLRFSAGVGLGFSAIAAAAIYEKDDVACALIGICIDIAVVAGVFHIAGRFRRRRDPWGWSETNPVMTFFVGIGCFATAALLAYLLHFLIQEDPAVFAFLAVGAFLTIASPWLVFCRK